MTEEFGTWEVIGLYHYIEVNSPPEYLQDYVDHVNWVKLADYIAKCNLVARECYE